MLFVTQDGGLTTGGYILTAIIIFALLIIVSLIANKKKQTFNARVLAFCAVALALATVTSMIKVWEMPMGGSITLLSMLFITLIGYWYGPVAGLITGVAYGLLQLILGPYIISLPQLLVDYPFAFGALGISGFFANQKNGLVTGYIAGIIGRFVFAVLSGVIFFGMYAPENMGPFVYSVAYNGSYIFAEGIITVIILMIPAVKKAMNQVKNLAAS